MKILYSQPIFNAPQGSLMDTKTSDYFEVFHTHRKDFAFLRTEMSLEEKYKNSLISHSQGTILAGRWCALTMASEVFDFTTIAHAHLAAVSDTTLKSTLLSAFQNIIAPHTEKQRFQVCYFSDFIYIYGGNAESHLWESLKKLQKIDAQGKPQFVPELGFFIATKPTTSHTMMTLMAHINRFQTAYKREFKAGEYFAGPQRSTLHYETPTFKGRM
jgi:hypothetical protein